MAINNYSTSSCLSYLMVSLYFWSQHPEKFLYHSKSYILPFLKKICKTQFYIFCSCDFTNDLMILVYNRHTESKASTRTCDSLTTSFSLSLYGLKKTWLDLLETNPQVQSFSSWWIISWPPQFPSIRTLWKLHFYWNRPFDYRKPVMCGPE
jgi:hypothetical protein